MNRVWKFIREQQGQDLVEYTLLIGFVVLASAGLFVSSGGSISGIWGQANGVLARGVPYDMPDYGPGPGADPGLVAACASNGGHLVYMGVGNAYSCQ